MKAHEERLEEFLYKLRELFAEFEMTGSSSEDKYGEFEFSLYDKNDVYMAGIRSIRRVGGNLEIVIQNVQDLDDKGIKGLIYG